MSRILGNNIIVYAGGVAIAATRSDEIQCSGSTIEISMENEQEWQSFIKGRKTWSLNVNWLATLNSDVQKLLDTNNTYTLLIKARDAANSTGVTGKAILTEVKIRMSRDSLVAGTFTFQGTGALTAGVNPQ